jgi:general secretion pathway protein G
VVAVSLTEFHPGRNAGSDAGFTLLELLVVIAILGLLTALVVPKLFNVLSSQKTKLATQQIDNIGGALDLYKLDAGSYPTTEQGLSALVTKPNDVEAWSGPYIKTTGVPADPWNHPFTYANPSARPGHDYDLCSPGANGTATSTAQPGQEGVICNP